MKLIVGLGNPGRKYQQTRHNLGFMVADVLLQDLAPVKKTVWKQNNKFKSLIAKIGEVIIIKPQTMMNASGFAVAKITKLYKLETNYLWVIHDDIDLPLGKIKIKKGGGSAGHRGLESIIQQLGSDDFIRFRLGIGRPHPKATKEKIEKYVLSPFRRKEQKGARGLVKKSVLIIRKCLEDGLEKTMNEFN